MTAEQPATAPSPVGRRMPPLSLASTAGENIDLSDVSLGDYVLFIYPRTGRPDEPEASGWALIPGAKGCTAESCEFRDLAGEYAAIGFSLLGLSTQSTGYQREAVQRLHLPYLLLSDPAMELGRELGLAHFTFDGSTLYKRCTLVVRAGVIVDAHQDIADAALHPHELLALLTRGR